MTQVLKKSGMLQDFDENKIKRAIEKSATRVVIELTEAQKDQVCKQVKNSLLHTEVVPVSTLHNLVETALDTVEPKVAKSYREYRDNKASFARMLDKVYNKKLSLSFIGDRSNANADSAIVTTQRAIVYNELNSELYKKFFLTVEEEKAMSEGYIYIHDRGSRLDSFNCSLSDVKEILTGGFEMGNLHYNEPKTLDVAFDLIGDIIMNMASCQYGGYTISEIDKLLAPYAKKSYDKYYNESLNNLLDVMKDLSQFPLTDSQERYLETKSYEYAMKKVKRDFEQGWQGLEMKLNSVGSSRGDYPFTAVSFGLGKDKFETLCTSVALDVRKNGQGKDGFKHPVLFPKLSFLYDEALHGEGKELEWLFLEAIDCSSKSMYPDFISCTGDGYCGDIYRKYGKTISRMGCVDYTETVKVSCNNYDKKYKTVMIGELFNKIKKGKYSNFTSSRVKNIAKYIKDPIDKEKFLKNGYIYIDGELFNNWARNFKLKFNRKPTRGDVKEFFGRDIERKSVRGYRNIDSSLFNLWDSYLEIKVCDVLKNNGFVEKQFDYQCTSEKDFVRNKIWHIKDGNNNNTICKQLDIYFPIKNCGIEVQDLATHSLIDNELYVINGQPNGVRVYKKGPSYHEEKRQYFKDLNISVVDIWETDIKNNNYDIIDNLLNIKLDTNIKVCDKLINDYKCYSEIIDFEERNENYYIIDIDGNFTKLKKLIKNVNVDNWICITLNTGKSIQVTTDHPLITPEGQTLAGDLSIGNYLIDDSDNLLEIINIEKVYEIKNSYDVQTESETFVFSGIQSHNCRATLAPWYVRGGFEPADENDYPIFEGRMNMGAISIHFPMILKKAQLKAEKENRNVDDVFFDELNYYCNLIRDIHKRTFDTFAEKKAGTNPMAFCQGGIYGGHFNPEEKIGREFLRPMTASFGITALNETQYLYNGKSLVEDQSFAIRILQWMDDLKKRATKEDGILYALYGTPAESLCFSGETIVQTYGGNKKIKDITTDDLVYSYNEFTNKIELKKVLASKKTKSNAVVVKVTFDNNQEIICTPDHPFGVRVVNKDAKGMWSGGEKINYISADNLKPGMRVKSNYMQLHGDYIETSTDQLVHRLVYEHFNGSIPNGYVIHHKDGNKLNNRIENLQLMSSKEHRVEHLHDTISKYTFTHENTAGVNNPFYGKKHTEESKERNRQAHLGKEPANKILINEEQFANNYLSGMTINDLTKIYPMKYGAVRNRLIKLGLLQQNHKVKSVEVLKDLIDVYDIEVEDNHNFFVGGDDGILVHNCGLQVEQYRKMFGEQEGITDKPYTSNSFHCAVYEDINPIQKQDIEYKMYHYCTGGAIQYCRYPIDYNKDAIITLVRRAMKMGFYEGINLQLDYCEECGHQFIDSDTCPKCGGNNITRIERMNGYLGYSKVHGRTMYADHKLQEFKDRKSM